MPAFKTLRDQFEEYKVKKGVKAVSIQALRWFYTAVQSLVKRATYSQTLDFGKLTTKPMVGKFYLYQYDPKWKDVLPVYDTCPLVLIVDYTEDGWYGINIHYMPPAVRLKVMEHFYKTVNDKNKSDRMKIRISWKLAQVVAKKVKANEVMENSFKRYLASHCKTQLLEVDPYYWAMICFLPLARWKKKAFPWK